MYKNQEEKMTDNILGEATMVLLKDDAGISSSALLRLLLSMAASEQDSLRQRACRSAIKELRNYSFSETESSGFAQPGRDGMSYVYTSNGSPDGTKKH